MAHSFYSSDEYKAKQRDQTHAAWISGSYDFLRKKQRRACKRDDCGKTFSVAPSDPKIFCSQSCSAKMSNSARVWSEEVKQKISRTLKGRNHGVPSPFKGVVRVPRKEVICANPFCAKVMLVDRWKKTKYCSNKCSMQVIGGKPTSPRASKGKAGVRTDVSSSIYFYSRWEANIARLYAYLGITWLYAPKTFDLRGQKYTPDFYLPESNTYIEVKNFWWKYSIDRDSKFRKRFPHVRLHVILKEEYTSLEKQYAHLIPMWEYKNSKF